MHGTGQTIRRADHERLRAAVHRHRPFSRRGLQERLFTLAFQRLVYPQIWEDPIVDLEALQVQPTDRIVAIASGGCNVLSYLTAGPAEIIAVDLNGAHIALNKLKICALAASCRITRLLRLFRPRGQIAKSRALRSRAAAAPRRGDPGLLGCARPRRAAAHRRLRAQFLSPRVARAVHRCRPCGRQAVWQAARRRAGGGNARPSNVSAFEREIAPLFEKRFVRWLARRPAALYGLGIPPSQYRALAGDGPDGIAAVLKRRVERLACDFPIRENYFAWQAFGARYALARRSQPAALSASAAISKRSARAPIACGSHHGSLTERLAAEPAESLDAYVLLDAQDWMNDAALTALWSEIRRTARPGARVIFRTAADERLLPGRVPAEILDAFDYDERALARTRRARPLVDLRRFSSLRAVRCRR